MESLMQPDDALLFEIRIFIDGLCVSGSVFGQRTNWPHIMVPMLIRTEIRTIFVSRLSTKIFWNKDTGKLETCMAESEWL